MSRSCDAGVLARDLVMDCERGVSMCQIASCGRRRSNGVWIGGFVAILFAIAPLAYAQTPTITSVSPTAGATGTPVTIDGTNFGTTQVSSTVTFNGVPSTPSSWSATQIVAPVPGSAIAFDAATAALHRDGGYFDPTQSFTLALWGEFTPLVGPGSWRASYA